MNLEASAALRSDLENDNNLDQQALVKGLLAGDRGDPITEAILRVYAEAADIDLGDGSQGNILALEAVRYAAGANAARHLGEYRQTNPQDPAIMLSLEALAKKSGKPITDLAQGPGISDLIPTASEIWNPVKWVWLTAAGLIAILAVFWFTKNKAAAALASPSPSPVATPSKKRPGRPKKAA